MEWRLIEHCGYGIEASRKLLMEGYTHSGVPTGYTLC